MKCITHTHRMGGAKRTQISVGTKCMTNILSNETKRHQFISYEFVHDKIKVKKCEYIPQSISQVYNGSN